MSAAHFVELAALLDEKDVDLAKSRATPGSRDGKLVVEHRKRLHLIDKDCPGQAAAIRRGGSRSRPRPRQGRAEGLH